jgi:hypothetical protein
MSSISDISRLEYFLRDVPTWPLKTGDEASQGAARWIATIGGLCAGFSLAEKVMAVEKKASGKFIIWVQRWRLMHASTDATWTLFVNDFVAEAVINRDKASPTIDELNALKQGPDEPAAEYIERTSLTMQLLPPESGYEQWAIKVSEATERIAAYQFCKGLRNDHPFKLKDQEPPVFLNEAFKAVMKFSKINRWRDVDSAETKVIRRYNERTPQQGAGTVKLGGEKVPREQFDKFEADFPGEQTENLSAGEGSSNNAGNLPPRQSIMHVTPEIMQADAPSQKEFGSL